jgi:aminoglycoside phosphotransferase (APT) family kinase protein
MTKPTGSATGKGLTAMNSDPRCTPLIGLEFEQIKGLLPPITNKVAVENIELVEGGLVNTLYRIRLADGDTFCLRIFARGSRAWEMENRILLQVSPILPVPEVIIASDSGSHFAYPYLIYRWIDGITLKACRKLTSPTDFLSLAEPLGRSLAGIAGFKLSGQQRTSDKVIDIRTNSIERLLVKCFAKLRGGVVRSRLGETLADALFSVLEAGADRLCALDRTAGLVHGDLGDRNILVAPLKDGSWRISGLIDWEYAYTGASLWDVGRVFRYRRRYSETFRRRFEKSYRDAGATLPEDWWQTSRLLDAIRLIEIFGEEKELPVVFAECRELLELLSAERLSSAGC